MDCSRPGPTVYILECADASYYVGLARDNLERRLWEHQSGFYGGYTSTRRPVSLVGSWEFSRFDEAIAFERQIKGWSRAKQEALIHGEYEKLPEFSKRRENYRPVQANFYPDA
jgi:putative endonuclease